jgi:ABC-type transport system substrate-binding protein
MPVRPSDALSPDDRAPLRLSRRRVLQAMSTAAAAGSAVAMAGPIALAAPIGTPQADATPKAGGAWINAISQEPDTLDPHKTGAAVA